MDDEILDIVNGHDQKIGTVNRKDYDQFLKSEQGFIRASELFIINEQGEIWTPIRTAQKKIAPNGYDYSAAGHVESGDDYLSTIIRETKEEINLDITPEDVEFVATVKSPNTKYIRSIYLLRSSVTPAYNPNDFIDASWLRPGQLLENIKAGHPAKSSLTTSVVVLLRYLSGD